MAVDSKLKALQRSFEIEERDVISEKKRIEGIVEERKYRLDQLLCQRDAIENKMETLRKKARVEAVLNGNAEQLASLAAYQKRIQGTLSQLSEVIAKSTKELDSALVRSRAAEEELLKIRVEIKKVEKFLENRRQLSIAADLAAEEALIDEINSSRARKSL